MKEKINGKKKREKEWKTSKRFLRNHRYDIRGMSGWWRL
jgi:hypothetical protein